MRRLLTVSAIAAGLFIPVASCGTDRATAPTLGRVSEIASIAAPSIVISQAYGGGGNAGSFYKNDFIEIFNPGASPVTVTGWSVQYASSGGSSWQVTTLSGTIPAGGYQLIQEAAGTTVGGGSTPLPTPVNASGTIAMSATAGKVFLVSNSTALSGTCPTANVIDQLNFGSTSPDCGQGHTSAPSNANAVLRGDAGCTYSQNNAADFAVGAPTPRNSASPTHTCPVAQTLHHVVLQTPTADAVYVGATVTLTADAQDISNASVNAAYLWETDNAAVTLANTTSATVSVTGVTAGQTANVKVTASLNGVSKSATQAIAVNAPVVIPPPDIRFSELHYDNTSTDQGEAIEIEGPAGTDLSGWKIVLYNGNPNPADQFNTAPLAAYDTRSLSGVIQARAACNSRGVMTFTYGVNGIQNGNQGGTQPDGLALVNASNQVVEFLSYEGSFTAVDGPASGMTSKDIGVMEDNPVPATGRSLQRSTDGTTWSGPSLATFDRCNLEGPPPPPNGISFSGRSVSNGDPPLPVDYEDQLFATLRDGATNAVITTTWTWTSETPDLASIDANGVMRGKAAGTAIFRATAADGTTATYSYPVEVLQQSTALYQNHAEFGEPADADNSDDYILRRREFTSSYNKNRGSPNWVAYNLEQSHFVSGQSDRCDCFTHDPLLPADFPRLTTADYTGSGGFLGLVNPETLDRGHMTRSSDRMSHTLDNANTYLLSNVVPQFGALNQGPWNNFEAYLHDLAAGGSKEIFIITGPAGNAGTLKNEGKIVMPTHTWKVAVLMDRDEGLNDVHSAADMEVLAVIMPNVDPRVQNIRNVDWHTYLTTVDAVEALSGYNLLALLDDQIEIAIESNTKPPVAKANGPYSGSEGSAIPFSAAGSSDPDGDALTYAWDFGDGTTGAGIAPSHTYAQDGAYTVTLVVTDIRGLTSSATTTATVSNVAPSVAAFAGAAILPHQTYGANGGFTDPGADNWTATVDYGDGSSPQALSLNGKSFSLSHTYAAPGSYTVTVSVNDGTATGTNTATVVVKTFVQGAQDIAPLLNGSTSLNAKLDAAIQQLDAANSRPALNQLSALLNEVDAMVRSRRMDSSDAAAIRSAVNALITSLSS